MVRDIAHCIFSDVLCFCQQSHCGREEAVEESCCACDDTVCSTVSEAVFALFVFEWRVSWMEGVSDDSLCSFTAVPTVNRVRGGKCGPNDPFCSLFDPLEQPKVLHTSSQTFIYIERPICMITNIHTCMHYMCNIPKYTHTHTKQRNTHTHTHTQRAHNQ